MAANNPFSASGTQQLRLGRRRIPIQFITDRNRRQFSFSKRKGGIMKKAFELSILTGAEVLLLVVSETGHVYTFSSPKFRSLISCSHGINLIRACLSVSASPHTDLTTPSSISSSNLPLRDQTIPADDTDHFSAAPFSACSDGPTATRQSTPLLTAPAIPGNAPITSSSGPVNSIPAHSGSHSPAPPDQLFMGSEQPVQISPLVLAVRLARLRANDQVIYLATVDKELMKCPGIATLLRRFALANGFSLDNCSNGSWGIHSLTGPASVISISLAGSISEIVVITFFSDSRHTPGQMIIRESFRFVRGSNSWLLQEWDGRYLDLRQIYFDLQDFISHGIIRLASHPIYQAEQTRILTGRLAILQNQWFHPKHLLPISEVCVE